MKLQLGYSVTGCYLVLPVLFEERPLSPHSTIWKSTSNIGWPQMCGTISESLPTLLICVCSHSLPVIGPPLPTLSETTALQTEFLYKPRHICNKSRCNFGKYYTDPANQFREQAFHHQLFNPRMGYFYTNLETFYFNKFLMLLSLR